MVQEQKCTSFSELGVAVVTHFGHPVFEVLEWVSIPRASTAHHLLRQARCKNVMTLGEKYQLKTLSFTDRQCVAGNASIRIRVR